MKPLLLTSLVLVSACTYDIALDSRAQLLDGGADDSASASVPFVLGNWFRLHSGTAGLLASKGCQLHQRLGDGSMQPIVSLPPDCIVVHRITETANDYIVVVWGSRLAAPNYEVSDYSIVAVDKTTLTSRVLLSALPPVDSVIADQHAIYFTVWMPRGSAPVHAALGELRRYDLSTTTTSTIYVGLDADPSLAADEQRVFVGDGMGDQIVAVEKTGTGAYTLASGVARPRSLQIHDGWIYFVEAGTTRSDGKVSRVMQPTPTQQSSLSVETLVSGLDNPWNLAVDSTELFWTSYFAGVYRSPRTGGTPIPVFETHRQGNDQLVLSDSSIYATARTPDDETALFRIDRP